ncbi:hypothetical protein J6R97_00630 [bacterium]|nr:hypothetical protein [bacterium]
MLLNRVNPIRILDIKQNKRLEAPNSHLKDNTTIPHDIAFESRVDKGLIRFYETNAIKMPQTVKTYIESLVDKASKTPLQAQTAAFIALTGITTIEEIKSAFPDDKELFKDLKNPEDSKATRGILGVYRENKELLKLYNQSILKNKENLTVWLVKKVFLEGKTIDEINIDFNKEIDSDFLTLYKEKENGENLIKSSTLKALGIKLPEFEYLQSLRYTRDGYSDIVGDKISQAQKDFYASLPPEERTARARKSVQKFENWWNSMSRNEQLDLIAFQIDEIELLKKFNNSEKNKSRQNKISNTTQTETKINSQNNTKVETTLSRDDLFKIWASNNLRIFKENLTEYDKQQIETRRERKRADWWASMSPQERTEYINKIKNAAEPLRYAMIDAWNDNQDILVELSHTLKNNHFNKPLEILYGTEEFNHYFSEIMTNFWTSHPEFAKRLGDSIKKSHELIKTAIDNGQFEMIKTNINNARIKRERDVYEALKYYREILPEKDYEAYPQYIKDLIDAYFSITEINMKLLPIGYVQDFFKTLNKDCSQEVIENLTKSIKENEINANDLSWTKNLPKQYNILTKSKALEATLANILYESTNNPNVFLLYNEESGAAIKQITDGLDKITVFSKILNQTLEIPIINRNINLKEMDNLYEYYSSEISQDTIDKIIDQFFHVNGQTIDTQEDYDNMTEFLTAYLNIYGKSCEIIFNTKTSKYTPEIRAKFAEKFLNDLPKGFDKRFLCVKTKEDFIKEDKNIKLINILRNKYKFLSDFTFDIYAHEFLKALRSSNQKEIDIFEKTHCNAKKTENDSPYGVAILSRKNFSTYNILATLAIEQSLADLLYESCGLEDVYKLNFEVLLSNYESIMPIKKFPVRNWRIDLFDQDLNTFEKSVEVNLMKRIQPYQIQKKIKEYQDEIFKYVDECNAENKDLHSRELMYILNPDENKTKVDEYTLERIAKAFQTRRFNTI